MIALYEGEKAKEMGFFNYIKGPIMEKLNELEGRTIPVTKLIPEVVMDEQINGTFIIYPADAKLFIRDFWKEAEEAYNSYIFRFGDQMIPHPFYDPCLYTFCMYDYGVRKLLGNIPILEDNWKEDLMLTPEVINEIGRELEIEEYMDRKPEDVAR